MNLYRALLPNNAAYRAGLVQHMLAVAPGGEPALVLVQECRSHRGDELWFPAENGEAEGFDDWEPVNGTVNLTRVYVPTLARVYSMRDVGSIPDFIPVTEKQAFQVSLTTHFHRTSVIPQSWSRMDFAEREAMEHLADEHLARARVPQWPEILASVPPLTPSSIDEAIAFVHEPELPDPATLPRRIRL